MSLRIACSILHLVVILPKEVVTLHTTFVIPKIFLESLIQEGFTVREISAIAGVSERTIYRRMTEYDLKIRDFSRVSDNQLDLEVLALTNYYPFCEEIILRELLKGGGFEVERYRLRDSIHGVNNFGVQAGEKGRLKRRVYNVKGGNHLWHIDTNHKHIKWYIIIFGAIDGYSRFPVSLDCINNNKETTLLTCFLKSVETYGIPSRVRSDEGKENVLFADSMIDKRGLERGSMITGPSTHAFREMSLMEFLPFITSCLLLWKTMSC